MSFPTSFQIVSSNVKGLGVSSQNKGNFRSSKISYKIKEICSNAGQLPTIFALSETKIKAGSGKIKIPNHVRYIGQSNNREGTGGILILADKKFEIEDVKNDVIPIFSAHAIYFKIKLENVSLENIVLYLPCKNKDCLNVLKEVEKFIDKKSLTNFSLYGDFNIDFQSPNHLQKITEIQRLIRKYNLYNLAEKLGVNPSYTFRGIGERTHFKSYIDHFFLNFDLFKNIKFQHNSYSDHKTISVTYSKQFIYSPPSWKVYLFRNDDFIKMLKFETVSFLHSKAKISSIKHNVDFYVNNPSIFDNELKFESENNHIETTHFFELLKHLKKHHDKFFSKIKLKNFNKCKDFDKTITSMYNEIDSGKNQFSFENVKNLIQQQQNFFQELSYNQAEFKLLRKLHLDGGCNNYTFKYISKSKKHDFNVKINGEFTNDSKLIADTLASMHAEVVSNNDIPTCTLDKLLADYDLTLNDIYPTINTLNSPFCTTDEFKKALKSMKNSSSPGISTQPPVLFEFLINLLPNFVTKALNNLYTMNLDNSEFKFIKDRNIVFIPKKDNDLSDLSNFRPISLLEVVYKLITKTLNMKLSTYLPMIVSEDQHGFMKNRQMANASLSITTTISHALTKNENIQLVSFDFKRAFEKILPEVVEKVLKHIFPNGNFAECLVNLFVGGRFRVLVNNYFSTFVNILSGGAQGGPITASIFIIVCHIFVSCLMSSKIKRFTYNIGKTILQPGLYADDVYQFFKFLNNEQINDLKQLLQKLKTSVGLEINFKKTKILVYGQHPNELESLGQICEYFKHLGIYISFDFNKAKQLTYDSLIKKLESRAKKIHMRAGFNLFKRRNLCTSLMNSLCFHIYRIYPPNKYYTDKLWKCISNFLWTTNKAGELSSRIKISQKRIELHYLDGGLNILKPEQQSFSIFITSFFSALNHASLYPKSTLGAYFAYKHLPVKSILANFGFQTITKYKNVFRQMYPNHGGTYIEKACSFFYDLEHSAETFFYSPILSSNWSNTKTLFTSNDEKILATLNKQTVASILQTQNLQNKICFLPKLSSEFVTNLNDNSLVMKLNNLLDAMKNHFPQANIHSKAKAKKFCIPLSITCKFKPSTLSYYFKKIYRRSILIEHPAIKSRMKDSLYFPDKEIFNSSFQKLFQAPLPIYYKNFFYEQYSRILISKNKMFKFKLIDNDQCNLCHVTSTTEHAIFFCHFAKFFIHIVALFLDEFYDINEFIFLKENFYLFNIYYEHFTSKEFTQLSLLTLIGKDRCLKISKDDCITRWSISNYYAQCLLISNFTSKILNYSGIENSFINSFYDYMINNKDKLMNIIISNI